MSVNHPNLVDALFAEGVSSASSLGTSPYPTLIFFFLSLSILLGAYSVFTELKVCFLGHLQ